MKVSKEQVRENRLRIVETASALFPFNWNEANVTQAGLPSLMTSHLRRRERVIRTSRSGYISGLPVSRQPG